MNTDLELTEAANALADLLEAGKSLRHPDHDVVIRPIVRAARAILRGYFRRQRKALLTAIRTRLKEDSGKKRALDLLPDSLSPLSLAVIPREEKIYSQLIADAIRKAEDQLSAELETTATIGDNSITRYLSENSLSKLTGNISETSKSRLRDAIAKAVDSGGTADDIVEAIQETMDDFSDSRANIIAQTEVNSAYNFGRHELAAGAGMNEKAWITESGDPCLECQANEAQGWIPIEFLFQSGDEFPTAHPMCYCSVDFRLTSYGTKT